MRGGIANWVTEHVGVTIALVSALAFVGASSAARIAAVHGAPAAAAEVTPEEEAMASEPASFAATRATYSSETKDALAYLVANAWADAPGTTVVTFTDRAIHTVSGGDERWEPYVVLASNARRSPDGATMRTLCLETTDAHELATLTVPAEGPSDETQVHATLACPAIADGAELTAAPELKPLAVETPDGDVLAACGTTPEGLADALALWCSVHRPTATAATWAKRVTGDYGGRCWEIPFDLDDRRATTVTVTVGMDDHAIDVREGK